MAALFQSDLRFDPSLKRQRGKRGVLLMRPVDASFFTKKFSSGSGRIALTFSLGLAACFPIAAEAQYYGRGWGPSSYDGGPYGGPYYGAPYGPYGEPSPYEAGDEGPEAGLVPGRSASRIPGIHGAGSKETQTVSLESIERRVHDAGMKLIATPRHKGNIYLAEVEDVKQIRRRLVYDSRDGHLLENTPLGRVKKPGSPDGPESKPNQSGKAGKPPSGGPAAQAKAGPEPRNEPTPDKPSLPPSHINEPAQPAPAPPKDGK